MMKHPIKYKSTYFYGSYIKTLLLNSIVIPVGQFEQFIVNTIEQVLENFELPVSLKIEAQRLINEELAHSQEHIDVNNALKSEGWNVEEIENKIARKLEIASKQSIADRLAMVAVMEVFIGIKSKMFIDGHGLTSQFNAPGHKQLIEHFEDEKNHYSIAYQLYMQLFGCRKKLAKHLFLYCVESGIGIHWNLSRLISKQKIGTKKMRLLKCYLHYFWVGCTPIFLSNNAPVFQKLLFT